MEKIMSDIQTMLDKIAAGDLNQAGDDFNEILQGKVADAIEAEKAEVGASIYGATEISNEELEDDDVEDYTDEELDDLDLDELED
jgi:hypothetical protein